MTPGDAVSRSFTVTTEDTAQALGSGDLPVLGTPRLVAWCEAVTCAVLEDSLAATQASVGTRVQLDHLAASPVGATVQVTATVAYVDGRLVRFEVVAQEMVARDLAAPDLVAPDLVAPDLAAQESEAEHLTGRLVAHGEVTRVVVDRARFISRLRR